MNLSSGAYYILTLFLLASCSSFLKDRRPAATPDCQENGIGCPFLNIGHRGAPYEEAENTIPACLAAIEQGANALEIDLVMTAEGEVALFHDRDPNALISFIRQAGLERQKYVPYNPGLYSGNRLPTEKLTLDELRQIYGYALSKGVLGDIFTNNRKDPNAYIPTIQEFAAWANQESRLEAVFLDIKLIPGQEELAAVMAEKFRLAFDNSPYRVYMLTPYESIYGALQLWINNNPDAPNRFLTLDLEEEGAIEKQKKLKAKLKRKVKSLALGSTVLRSWNAYIKELDEVLDRARRKKDKVYPVISWTVDDERKLYQLLQMGVDGILTNRPDRLNRLLNRHWKDHSMAAKTLAACYEQARRENTFRICATGSQLAPLHPIGQEEIRRWACQEQGVHSSLKDFYGCGGLFDKVNIVFNTKIENDPSVVMMASPKGSVEVVKLPVKLSEQDELVFLDYQQDQCDDGVLNHRCEYQLQLQHERAGKWVTLPVVSNLKDSFYHIAAIPKSAKALRVILSETDDGKVNHSASLAFVPRDDFEARVRSASFKGRLKTSIQDFAPLLKKSELISVALEFSEKGCNDGFLNYKCEYQLEVEVISEDGIPVKLQGSKHIMKGSFVAYSKLPRKAKALRIGLKEMDEREVSAETEIYMEVIHGMSMLVASPDSTFHGDFTIKLLDYDESKEHSEGDPSFAPHQQKNRKDQQFMELNLP